MNEPWIRVHANLGAKPVTTRVAKALGVSLNEAVGLLVRFWGALSQFGANGSIAGLEDELIEGWAGWRGKRGRFAAFVREHHADLDGRVREWDAYNGKLEARRQKDRDRKRSSTEPPQEIRGKSNGASAGNPPEPPQEGRTDSIPARAVRNEDEDETRRNESSSSSARGVSIRLTARADRLALEDVLAAAPNPAAWVGEMVASLEGMHGTTLTPEQLGEALRDYVANGATKQPNFKHFRAYLRRAAVEPRSAGGSGLDGQFAALDQWAKDHA